MARRPMDVAPAGPLALPDTGIGRGWEPAVLMVTTLLLLSFGLVTLYSASAVLAQRQALPDYHYVLRQASGAGAGLLGLFVCARIPYRAWGALAWPLVGVTFVALLLLVVPGTEAIAPEVNGARRWLDLGVRVQPSELAKVTIVVWTAMMAVRKRDQFGRLSRGLAPFMVVWGLLLLLVALEPDLSTACVLGMLGVLTVFAAGARAGHFLFLGGLTAPVLLLQLGVGFRADRIRAFLDPAADPEGTGFQVWQSLIAVGSGGLTGRGFGEGHQKFGFLPEAHNDFIFAMIGEEWGLLGVLLLVVLYAAIVLVGYRIARRAPDFFGQLLAIGFTNLVALQALLHMGISLGVVPPTGLALPLVSYGRSNLLVTLAALGVLMSIARESEADPVRRVHG
ncbi:MAG: putative peptidoglycan glycosyltransferase FtsW [Gemmatimonadota bacterium]